jgi:hypothetical protein
VTRIKDITFEGNSLTGASGFDSTLGTPTVNSTSPLKGVYDMATTAVGDFGREDFTAVDSIFLSFYIKFAALPASTQTRTAFIRNGTTALCGIRITSAGKVQLRDAANTQVGSDSATTLTTGNLYRIGLRYTKGTGANAVLEAFVATTDNAFGAAFATTSADTGTAQASRVEVGQGASGTVCTVNFDDVKIDDTTMPGPSGSTEISTTFLAKASFYKEADTTFAAKASFQGLIDSTFLARASFATTVDTTFLARASFIVQADTTFAAKASFQGLIDSSFAAAVSFYRQVPQDFPFTVAASFSALATGPRDYFFQAD